MKSVKEKQSYLKSITTLVSGSILAQCVTVICAPILTRLCSAEVLGIYTLVTGAVTIFGTVMSLRYELCIVSESEENVYPLIKISFILCVVFSVFIGIGYSVYFIIVHIGEQPLFLALITGMLVFLLGVINIVTSYNNRQQEYHLITKTYVIRVLSQNICNVIAALLKLGPVGLSFSQAIGYMAGVKGQSKALWKDRKRIAQASGSDMYKVMVKNKNQAILSTPAALSNGLSYSLINYFIEALYSVAEVGYYSISYRILGLPLTLISSNVSRVFFERASKEYRQKGNFASTYMLTITMMIGIGIPMGGVMFLLAPWACGVFLGSGWEIAGTYIQLLIPMFVLRFIAGGVNTAAIIVNRQKIDLGIQILLVVCAGGCFIFSRVSGLQIENYLGLLNSCYSVIYIIYIYLFWRCAKAGKSV